MIIVNKFTLKKVLDQSQPKSSQIVIVLLFVTFSKLTQSAFGSCKFGLLAVVTYASASQDFVSATNLDLHFSFNFAVFFPRFGRFVADFSWEQIAKLNDRLLRSILNYFVDVREEPSIH